MPTYADLSSSVEVHQPFHNTIQAVAVLCKSMWCEHLVLWAYFQLDPPTVPDAWQGGHHACSQWPANVRHYCCNRSIAEGTQFVICHVLLPRNIKNFKPWGLYALSIHDVARASAISEDLPYNQMTAIGFLTHCPTWLLSLITRLFIINVSWMKEKWSEKNWQSTV